MIGARGPVGVLLPVYRSTSARVSLWTRRQHAASRCPEEHAIAMQLGGDPCPLLPWVVGHLSGATCPTDTTIGPSANIRQGDGERLRPRARASVCTLQRRPSRAPVAIGFAGTPTGGLGLLARREGALSLGRPRYVESAPVSGSRVILSLPVLIPCSTLVIET